MAKNLGNKVSRVLDSENRNFSSIVFQQKRPPLDSEFNLLQEIQSENLAKIIRSKTPSGFLELGPITTAPEDRNLLSADWKNAFKFKNPLAIVNGWLIHIGGGTNQIQANSLNNIWRQISNDPDEIAFILTDPPTTAFRQDLVFMEVWQSIFKTGDPLNIDGFIQSAQVDFNNDLIDPNLEIETSQRVQIQYRFRRVEGIDFISFREGLGHPSATCQGPLANPTTLLYRKHPNDSGLYIAGNGDETSQKILGTVDGFVYAIPICRVHRKNKVAYSLANQNGSQYSILTGFQGLTGIAGSSGVGATGIDGIQLNRISDRPDGLYNDEISKNDIEDLRHKVTLNTFEYENLMESNLVSFWKGDISGELKSSTVDENVIGNRIIQVDAISETSIQGADTSARKPDGVRRSFTEAKEIQKISFNIQNPDLTGGNKFWFVPKGKKQFNYEYELWNENIYYPRINTSLYRPRVFIYNEATADLNEISGGVWYQLGEYRLYDYIDDVCKNRIEYVPEDPAIFENKKVCFVFDFITREGGGIGNIRGGFTYQVDEMLDARNLKLNSFVEFNKYDSTINNKVLTNRRSALTFFDSAVTRSISRFEEATNSVTLDDKYRGACIEIQYYILSSGLSTVTIPDSVYGRKVYGIYSLYNITTQTWQNPTILDTVNGFDVSGIVTNQEDILQFTLLCGDYSVDYIPHIKGISNIVKNEIFPSTLGPNNRGVINVKNIQPQCDAALASIGFFDGVSNSFVGFINQRMVKIKNIEGLGTPVIRYEIDSNAILPQGTGVNLHLLCYYNPIGGSSADQMVFTYYHKPYRGIASTRLSGTNTERFKIIKIDKGVAVSSAGTGSRLQYISDDMKGFISRLPINTNTLEYNFFGSNIYSPLSGGNSSLRRVSGRGRALENIEDQTIGFHEDQIITLGNSQNLNMLRGVNLINPNIYEEGYNLNVPDIRDENGNLLVDPSTGLPYDIVFNRDMTTYNHLTQWTALVEGLDSYKSELFLLVITTTSTIYNSEEGLEYEYLELKNLYTEKAYGKGKDTVLRNGLTNIQINQGLGRKILGAADIIPLNGRPLVKF
jgi:hypothetical protein